MRHQYRYKSIVIPKIGDKYIVVKDKKSGEYTFIGGGCKLRETSVQCALRELAEETRNSVIMNPSLLRGPTFTFESRARSPKELLSDKNQGVYVTMVYSVYVVSINESFEEIKRLYYKNKFVNNNETSGIFSMSYQQLVESPRVWQFMRDNILPRLAPGRSSTPASRSNRW